MFELAPPGICETMEKIRGQKADFSSQNFILNYGGVVGLSRHDGFYRPSTEEKDPNTRGVFETVTPGPKNAEGKESPRIVQSDASMEEESPVSLGRNRVLKKTTKGAIRPRVESSMKPHQVIDLSGDSVATPANHASTPELNHDRNIPQDIVFGKSLDLAGNDDSYLTNPEVENTPKALSILQDIKNSSNKENLSLIKPKAAIQTRQSSLHQDDASAESDAKDLLVVKSPSRHTVSDDFHRSGSFSPNRSVILMPEESDAPMDDSDKKCSSSVATRFNSKAAAQPQSNIQLDDASAESKSNDVVTGPFRDFTVSDGFHGGSLSPMRFDNDCKHYTNTGLPAQNPFAEKPSVIEAPVVQGLVASQSSSKPRPDYESNLLNPSISYAIAKAKRMMKFGKAEQALKVLKGVLERRRDEMDQASELELREEIAALSGSLGILNQGN